MAEETEGEIKLLKVWECRKCKALIRYGKSVYDHKCNISEDGWKEDKRLLEGQKSFVEEQKKIIEDKDKFIEDQKNRLEEKDNSITNLKDEIEKHKNEIDESNKKLAILDKSIYEQKIIIEDKGKVLDEKNRVIGAQNESIEKQKTIIKEYEKVMDNQKRVIDSNEKVIKDQNEVISDLKSAIKEKEETASEKILSNIGDIDLDVDIGNIDIDKEIGNIKEKKIEKGKDLIKTDKKFTGEQIYVDIWSPGVSIKDSKDLGFRPDLDIELFEKGKGKKRIIIRAGRVNKKPDDIDIIGKYTPEGFIIKGIQKND
jgi:hypothetical protein